MEVLICVLPPEAPIPVKMVLEFFARLNQSFSLFVKASSTVPI